MTNPTSISVEEQIAWYEERYCEAQVQERAILSTLRTAAANERDARRYQFLRNNESVVWSARRSEDGDPAAFIWSITFPTSHDGTAPCIDDDLDMAIDAAIAKESICTSAQLAVGEK